jgi:hypothetical protein
MSDSDTTELTEVDIHNAAGQVVPVEPSPVSQIESSLGGFLQGAFQIAQEDDAFHKQIQADVIRRLPTLTDAQVLALVVNNKTNFNDLISKLLAPTMQLATAKQQAEIAARREQQSPNISQTNIKEINQGVPQQVLVGLKNFSDLMQMLSQDRDRAPNFEEARPTDNSGE